MRVQALRWKLQIAFAVIFGLMLAACGTQTATSPTPSPTPTPKPAVEVRDAGALGKILVAGSNGLTLYKWSMDTPGVSKCKDQCATRWPPLTVTSGQKATGGTGVTGALDLISRADGAMQVTYRGAPLYFFQGDQAAGDTKGNGVGGTWSVVSP